MDQTLKDKRAWAFLALVAAVFVALLVWSQQAGEDADEGSGSAGTPVAEVSPSGLPTDATGIPTAVGPAPTATGSEDDTDSDDGAEEGDLPGVPLDELPPEAAETVELIDAGGPFPYDRDGSTFGNYEGLLPEQPYGYYAEYTVETPGSPDRGARRIVVGDQGELYWTEDHYASFSRIER